MLLYYGCLGVWLQHTQPNSSIQSGTNSQPLRSHKLQLVMVKFSYRRRFLKPAFPGTAWAHNQHDETLTTLAVNTKKELRKKYFFWHFIILRTGEWLLALFSILYLSFEKKVWASVPTIYLLVIIESFMGYVLVWVQMSF
ncbi:unnamed protein product [Nippostrongylus brasiliensis]|uniref:XK-related protein n=1 Tax=Nippostrongylus brasiliensis TaxID=27835 RepID=A0A0N4YDM1_NIPBR|nr:unnamed protein product [Nippostrongylus brasiliensis]